MFRRKRIVITGAAGFVGASLTRAFLEEGHEIHAFLRPESSTWRFHDLRHRFTTHLVDLRESKAVNEAIIRSRPDVVFHAATSGAHPSQKDRMAILSSNILGTANLLDAVERHADCTFVNLGSSSEYGWCDHPMRETDSLHPRSDYGVSKAAATLLCQSESYRGKPVVTVRLFSVYGPWEDPTRLASYVMGCCRRGESPCVGDGHQPRDFIYIDDVIDLLRIAAESRHLPGTILHAGTGRTQTVRDMIETILAVCGQGVVAQYGAIPNRTQEPNVWVADISRTTELTGWQPRYSLRAGVEAMWTWHSRALVA